MSFHPRRNSDFRLLVCPPIFGTSKGAHAFEVNPTAVDGVAHHLTIVRLVESSVFTSVGAGNLQTRFLGFTSLRVGHGDARHAVDILVLKLRIRHRMLWNIEDLLDATGLIHGELQGYFHVWIVGSVGSILLVVIFNG